MKTLSEPSTEGPGATGPEAVYSDDGVDLSLIRWMLTLSPRERLEMAQDMMDTVWLLREDQKD